MKRSFAGQLRALTYRLLIPRQRDRSKNNDNCDDDLSSSRGNQMIRRGHGDRTEKRAAPPRPESPLHRVSCFFTVSHYQVPHYISPRCILSPTGARQNVFTTPIAALQRTRTKLPIIFPGHWIGGDVVGYFFLVANSGFPTAVALTPICLAHRYASSRYGIYAIHQGLKLRRVPIRIIHPKMVQSG